MKSRADRFFEKVDPTGPGGCWIWTGSTTSGGYGNFRVGDKNQYAHRFSYEYHIGPIPDGLVVDHLCRVRNCVNPSHLEAVTFEENVRRGESGSNMRSRTECPSGHPYSEENTRVYNRKGGGTERKCLACKRKQARETARRKRQRSTK